MLSKCYRVYFVLCLSEKMYISNPGIVFVWKYAKYCNIGTYQEISISVLRNIIGNVVLLMYNLFQNGFRPPRYHLPEEVCSRSGGDIQRSEKSEPQISEKMF